MTSRNRIKNILELKTPDRIGILDDFTDNTVHEWKKSGSFSEGEAPQEYFDFDIRLFGFNQDFNPDSKNAVSFERVNNVSTGESLKDNFEKSNLAMKFLTLSCMEPFEHIARAIGREKLLVLMAEDAGKAVRLFTDSSEFTLRICQSILDKGYCFDGAWLWGDLGYKKGLFFSTDYYNDYLFDFHKEFCGFFAKNNMPVIFHSDGNIRELMPRLIEAGIRAIEPLECGVGMDLAEIKREYGKDIVLFGGIDELLFTDIKKTEEEIESKFGYLMKGGGYIYHADSPIPENVTFENYKKILELVKKYGTY
ncbi:MAG: uroporphyrinogen decarboxylase family protein [Candidatus Omnitrophota bacterium]|nr:uroporphyrinogen decarboxylase family protein [Candidatus Omnitrophota bacterium]